MTNTAILAASALLMFAYLLDIVGRRSAAECGAADRHGMLVRHLTDAAGLHFIGSIPSCGDRHARSLTVLSKDRST
jgi:hypothetical protein